MKKKITSFVAVMVMIMIASANISQASGMHNNTDTYSVLDKSEMTEKPAIARSIDAASYQMMNRKEMESVEGEVVPIIPAIIVGMTYMGVKYVWDRSHNREYKPFGKW